MDFTLAVKQYPAYAPGEVGNSAPQRLVWISNSFLIVPALTSLDTMGSPRARCNSQKFADKTRFAFLNTTLASALHSGPYEIQAVLWRIAGRPGLPALAERRGLFIGARMYGLPCSRWKHRRAGW